MSDVRTIWRGFETKYGQLIQLCCKDCEPPFGSDNKPTTKFRCGHELKGIWIFSDDNGGRQSKWTFVREIPEKKYDRLCPNNHCQGGKRRCGGAHGEAELDIWSKLQEHGLYLHTFLPKLVYYEEETTVAPIKAPPSVHPAKIKKRGKHHPIKPVYYRNNAPRLPVSRGGKYNEVLTKCGGGRFVFACKNCYNLEPRIVKEMEVGSGRAPMIACKWCNGKEYFLFHESTSQNKFGVTFYEYQEIRRRLSTTRGSELCRILPNCPKRDDCTYAHSFLELQVWRMEADGGTRVDLFRHSSRNIKRGDATPDGMFHCDCCCLIFPDHRLYLKYMESSHESGQIPKIHRCSTGWIFRPLPKTESKTLALCGQSCKRGYNCTGTHCEDELREWEERLKISKARSTFRLDDLTESHTFDLQQKPKLITEETRVQTDIDRDHETEISFDVRTYKWKMEIRSTELRLRHAGFENHFEYQLRHVKDEQYSKKISLRDDDNSRHEFIILFKNPSVYGEHVGDLFFEFEDAQNEISLLYFRFRVNIKGDRMGDLQIVERTINADDWTINRIIVPYPHIYQHESYDKHIKRFKATYKLSKTLHEHVNLKNMTKDNYVERMHALLYQEERGRHNVLSRLNMRCVLSFVQTEHSNGHLFATFNVPISVSTEEGTLFKNSCKMLYVGEDDDYAYEAKIRSSNIEEVTIDLSPECVSGLNIIPGSTRTLQVQFQLDRDSFGLRHYTLDHIGDKVSLVCPSRHLYASLQYDVAEATIEDLDDVQNAVFNYLRVEKRREPRNVKINERKGYPPLIVAGPFGTGKTHTIKTILLDLMKNGNKDDTILLCTHANRSADLYLMDPRFQQWKSEILRLYYHGRERDTVDPVVQQFCLLYGRGFRYPSVNEIRKYRLIVTTFSTAVCLNLETGLSGNLFQYIFLDEASQAMEAEAIMPLLLANSSKTRVVIAGDHRQISEKMYCDNNTRVLTLLERMYEEYEDVSKRSRILLTNNYRCVDEILSLITKLFYKENILQSTSNEKCLPGMQSVYFIQLKGECTPAHNGEYNNESEAYQIAHEVQMLVREREVEGLQLVKPEEIVVLSSFYSQVQLLREILRAQGLRNISVQTVRDIQGQEFKVVILCTVMRRTNCLQPDGKNYGFLSDHRLLNTALTRAKSLIVVIGDAVTLCSTGPCKKYWKSFIKYCEENRTILPENTNVESVKRDIKVAKKKLNINAAEYVPNAKETKQRNPEVDDVIVVESDSGDGKSGENTVSETSESSYEDDGNDSWCSDDSFDDLILDDMIKRKTGIDPRKITVGVGKVGDEYIQYGSDDDEEEDDDDPNEMVNRPSRRRRGRGDPIFPKYTVGQLEAMLRRNDRDYVRCKIRVETWYSGKAIPVREENSNVEVPKINFDQVHSDSSHDFDEESMSSDDAYSLEDGQATTEKGSLLESVPTKINSDTIFIETRVNLGRTFDQDEVLVKIIDRRKDSIHWNSVKKIGKVLGVLKKRYNNPRLRHFLCTPDEFNSNFMCPIDKKLPKFAILAPKNHNQSARSDIPIYKTFKKGRREIELLRLEKLDNNRVYVVRYLQWYEYCPYPLGYVAGSFERGDFHKYLKLEYSVPGEYKNVLRQKAKQMKTPTPGENPVIDVFTIDPEGSLDLDDAISFEKCHEHESRRNTCYLIGIHITDVACVVKEGSEIDKEAQKRFSTFYGGQTGPVHMLPDELGTNKCSILPGGIRPAISTFFHSSDEAPPTKKECPVSPQRTFIRSTRRLTYRDAEILLRAKMANETLEFDEDVTMSETLHELWKIMWDWRIARVGGEAYYKNGDTYTGLVNECRAHLLIEEAMISVNANTAAFLSEQDFEIPMRVQDIPDEEEWTDWNNLHSNLIRNSPYLTSCEKYLKRLKRKDEGENESEGDVSEEEGGRWEEAQSRKRKRTKNNREVTQVLSSIDPIGEIRIFKRHWDDMIRSMEGGDLELFSFIAGCDDLHPSLIDSVDRYRSIQKKASFNSQNTFHFSLRLKKYAWTSSPMRRYVDILIQRCIHKALEGEPASETTEQAIKRVCSFYDDRHSQYEEKLMRARVSEDLKSQPVVLEAAVVQITDAFLKIAIPALGKHIMRIARELRYGCLMVTGGKEFIAHALDEQTPKFSKNQMLLTNMDLVWKLRYYNCEKLEKTCYYNEGYGKTVKVPIQEWRAFTRIISSPPRITDSEYKKLNYATELTHAVESMERTTQEAKVDHSDTLTEETRNKPIPIKHKREIKWKVFPGSTFLLQLSGSHEKSRLPEPAVQLLSIAEDLDICVEHMRDPLNIFARDAEQVKGIVVNSKSLVSYRKKWEPLVRMDAANSAVKEMSSTTLQGVKITWNKAKKQKEASRDALMPDAPKSRDRVVHYFRLQFQFCYERYIDFHQGDLLCLRLKGVPCVKNKVDKNGSGMYSESPISTHTVVVHAVITRVKMPEGDDVQKKYLKNLKVYFEPLESKLSEPQRTFAENPESKWTVELIALSLPHRFMQDALMFSGCTALIQAICLGTIHPTRISLSEELEERIVKKELKRFKYSLNAEQREQEQKAIRHDFSIIQGPPGTGKSFLGAQIAAKFAYMNIHRGNLKKVLYCGPSNKSVDVAAGFLKDTDLKVVRMYTPGLEARLYPNPLKPKSASLLADDGKTPNDNLKSVALHEIIRRQDNPFSSRIREFDRRVKSGESFERRDMDEYTKIVSEAKKVELAKADIVICTCSYSVPLAAYGVEFGQCIIDECAMCSEPETILPLVANKPEQVVLIGDHMQLRPVITCNRAERFGLGKSLFSRYTDFAGMLTNQYRMHPTIMNFPSKQFYEGRLKCDQSVMDRAKSINIRIASRSEAVFWNVKGIEKVQHFKTADEGENSKYNMSEAHAVIKVLLRLHSYQIPLSRIMVLSPYTAQCARIRELIKTRHSELKDVHVGTVVTSQGSEADTVILSTVRSLPESSIMKNPNIQWLRKNLGFLTDPNQINVALTRARQRLFIIGNKNLLEVDTLWGKLLLSYEARRAVIHNLY